MVDTIYFVIVTIAMVFSSMYAGWLLGYEDCKKKRGEKNEIRRKDF
jgi:hypothetical protein